MNIRAFGSAAVLAALLAPPALGDEKSRKIALEKLPAPVRKAVEEQATGGKIRAVVSEVGDGTTVYEAELVVNGRKRDVRIDEAGTVLEIEEEIPVGELPEKVKAAAMQAGRILKAESVTKDGKIVYYEIDVKARGKKSELKLSPEGEHIER